MNSYSLLIADDDEITREGIRKYLLKSFPLLESIRTAKDGQEAFALFEEHQPDIVLTDIAMPRCDGLELVEHLHQNGYYPKVVILSAHENFSYAQNAVRLGVGDYLIKPVMPAQIREILQKLLDELEQHSTFLNNISDMMNKYQENLPVLRERFFHSILHEDFSENQILEKARLVDLDLSGSAYTTAVLRMTSPVLEHASLAEKFANFLSTVIDAMFPPEIKVHYTMANSSDAVLVIISGDGDTRKLFRTVNTSLNRLLSSAKKYTNLCVSGALGRQYKSAGDIRKSYQEAMNALTSENGKATGSIRNYEDISPGRDLYFRMDGELENSLLQSVKYQSYARCLELIDQMGEQAENCRGMKFEYIKTYFLKVTVLILRDLQNYNDGRVDFNVDFNCLLSTANLEACLVWFKLFVNNVVESYQRLNREKGSSLVNRAKHIINDNIANSDFNIDEVASVLYISSNYLRQIFRQQTDESFVEYLTRIRMEKAMDLLKNSNMKIQDIADSTGFSNQRYFAVCFKKHFGKTPTEFRLL